MSDWSPPTNEQIANEAYLLWEADGRPFGLDHEYWLRASGLLTERARRAAEDATRDAEEALRDEVGELEFGPWARRIDEKPVKLAKVRRPKPPPRMRGPGTRLVKARG